VSGGTVTRTQLQYAISELEIVFCAASNVLSPDEYGAFVDIAFAYVARRGAELLEREWREAA
jgi:hypothetical protein